MMQKKRIQKKIVCTICKKAISRKNHTYVFFGTYNRHSKKDDEQWFHFSCFRDWFNKKVEEKAFGLASLLKIFGELPIENLGDPLFSLLLKIIREPVREKKFKQHPSKKDHKNKKKQLKNGKKRTKKTGKAKSKKKKMQ